MEAAVRPRTTGVLRGNRSSGYPGAYIDGRARTSIRRGLLAAAASPPRRRVRGTHGSVRGLHGDAVPLAGGEVPRRDDGHRLPGVPQGPALGGQLRVRRPPRLPPWPGQIEVE